MIWGQTKPVQGSQIDWSHNLAKGIVGCWLFNEGMGDKIYDISGNGRTATLNNFPFPKTSLSGWHNDLWGSCLKFGTDNYPYASNTYINKFPILNSTSQFTFIFKIRPISASKIIFTTASNKGGICFSMSGLHPNMAFNWVADQVFTQLNVVLGNSYFIAFSMIGNTATCYLYDLNTKQYGKQVITVGSFVRSSDMGFLIGRNSDGTSLAWNGSISYIYFYNRVLIENEILQIITSPYCFIK